MALPLFLATLASSGLGILRDAILAKGKEFVEDKIGVKIPDDPAQFTPEKRVELMQAQFKHEEFLINAALEEKRIDTATDKGQEEERTKRWVGDMQSDSWLSKNVRPATLIYWTIALTLLIIADSALDAFKVDPLWIDLIKISYLTILGAYFVIRGAEKGVSMVTKMMEKKNVTRR